MLPTYFERISDSHLMNLIYLDRIQELDMHDYQAMNAISCCHTYLSIEPDQLNDFV